MNLNLTRLETRAKWVLSRQGELLGDRGRSQARIPTAECIPQIIIEGTGPNLQQQMCAALRPAHLLFHDHPAADHLIHGRLNKRC